MIGKFGEFLESVDLERYRDTYKDNRSMEADMPKNTRTMPMLYRLYWEKKIFLFFEDFYNEYVNSVSAELESLRIKLGYTNSDATLELGARATFYNGLKARTYRTWASLMTQIHAGYVALSVFW